MPEGGSLLSEGYSWVLSSASLVKVPILSGAPDLSFLINSR